MKWTLEDIKAAFAAGQERKWEDLEQTVPIAKYDEFEEWFETYKKEVQDKLNIM